MGGIRNLAGLVLVLGGIGAIAFLMRGMDSHMVDRLCAQYAESRGVTFQESRYNTRFRLFGRHRGYYSCVFAIPQANGASLTQNIPVWRIPYLPLWLYGFFRFGLFIILGACPVLLGRVVLDTD